MLSATTYSIYHERILYLLDRQKALPNETFEETAA